jgi:HAD superfamily hydrolase (TIGR01549 family)
VFRGIFFDLDDTLFDRTAALRRWVARHVGALDAAELAWVIELDDRGRQPRLVFAAGIVERYGLQRTVTELASAFPGELAAQVEPEPGVGDVLARLASRCRVAIVTNGGASQRDKLARAGLAGLVSTVFVSGELGIAKPAPEIFERALAWSELPPGECLFVGDDPKHDTAALGMATAWRTRDVPARVEAWPPGLASPRFTIRTIAELETCA